MERPEYVPENFIYVVAPDGCAYWVHSKYLGDENYFIPCSRFMEHELEESWHTGDELKAEAN